MQHRQIASLLAGLLAWIVLWTAPAPAGTRAGDGFTIDLPEGWQEIPEEALADYYQGLTDFPDSGPSLASAGRIGHGWQPAVDRWFEPPFVLALAYATGRLSESEIGGSVSTHSPHTVLHRDWDSDRMVHTAAYRLPGAGGEGGLVCLSGVFFTDKGILNILAYAPEGEYESLRPGLEAILGSVRLAPDLEYGHRRRLIWSGLGVSALISAAWFVVAGRLSRRRRSPAGRWRG